MDSVSLCGWEGPLVPLPRATMELLKEKKMKHGRRMKKNEVRLFRVIADYTGDIDTRGRAESSHILITC